jgi:hypothetical protein
MIKDFNKRSTEEKEWLLNNTWCDHCLKADLGMKNHSEYESNGKTYIEGICVKCSNQIKSEINNK